MRIAVVIPVYNRPQVVLEALQTVVEQTRQPDRWVVVDDGSTDQTLDSIATWLRQKQLHERVLLIRQANAGVAEARSAGIAAAGDCELLAPLDSDDLWPDDYLCRAERAMTANPQAVAATSPRIDLDTITGKQKLTSYHWLTKRTTEKIFVHGPSGTSSTVMRLKAIHQAGGYPKGGRFAEDYSLQLRVSLLGPWLHLPGEPVVCRLWTAGHADPATQARKALQDRRLRLAEILEAFIRQEGAAEGIDPKLWRRRLGRLWFSAGRQQLAAGHRERAHVCFSRTLELLPWHLRARLRNWATS